MSLAINQIKSILPHRYPFLLVDRVLELEQGSKAVAIKNVTVNEEFFQGHYPEVPIMPGVLLVEAMAQVSGIVMLGAAPAEGKIPLFAGIDKCRFRRQVVPGDQLRIEVEVLKMRGNTGRVQGKITVDGELAASAEVLFVLADQKH